MSYTTLADVESMLGITMTVEQQAQCERVIVRTQADINTYTDTGWGMPEQTLESHAVGNSRVTYLRYVPVASVTSVMGRACPGEPETVLVVDEDYEIDLATGRILLLTPWGRIRVTYTQVATIPEDIRGAATEWVVARMMPTLQPGTYGLDSVTLPDYAVKFSRDHVQRFAPSGVMEVLDAHKRRRVG